MNREGILIWQRNASFNRSGTRAWCQPRPHIHGEEPCFCRRHRFRTLKRFIELERRYGTRPLWSDDNTGYEFEGPSTVRLRMRWAVSLGRRPLRKDLFNDAPQLRPLISFFSPKELKKVCQVALATQDASNKSIFLHNISFIARYNPKFKIVTQVIKNPLFMLDAVQKSVRRGIQSWLHQSVARFGVIFMFRFQMLPTASSCMLDLLQNGTTWGRKKIEEIH